MNSGRTVFAQLLGLVPFAHFVLAGLPVEVDLPGLRMGVIFPAMMQFCMPGQLFKIS